MEGWLIRVDIELIKQALIQLVTFLCYYVIIKKFFYDKIKGIMVKRQEMVSTSLDAAKAADEKALQLENEYAEKVAQLEKERAEMIKKSAEDAKQTKERIIQEAKDQAQGIIESANRQIEKDMAKAQEEFKDSIVDLTMDAAEKVVKKSLSRQDHIDLINESISMLKEV